MNPFYKPTFKYLIKHLVISKAVINDSFLMTE
jgi:hypothetical protein